MAENGYAPRLFADCDDIRTLGEHLLGCTLPKEEWTHEAHLAATTYLVVERADIDLDRDLPNIIRRYNESVDGINDETQGYHETITRVYLAAVRDHVNKAGPEEDLAQMVNNLLRSERGRRDWPLRFYSKERLFSVEARMNFIQPDLEPLA